MLTIVGLSIIFCIVALLLAEKVSPVICLIVIPLIGAFIAGFDLEQIKSFYLDGTKSVSQVAIMFIFAILFFGVMNDAGLFDPLIKELINATRGNVVAVAVGTVIVSAIAQLDGAGASTFLLIVPPLLPLYKRLKMNPYLLFLLLAASAGIVNMLPWGGPTGRVASVLGMQPDEVWRPLIPVQIAGIFVLLILSFFLGLREQRRIQSEGVLSSGSDDVAGHIAQHVAHAHEKSAGQAATSAAITHDIEEAAHDVNRNELLRPNLIWVNFGIFILTMTALVKSVLPAGYIFMIAVCVALLVNYRTPKAQMERINAHAGGAIMMASIIFAAGTFLGILKNAKMLNSIATDLVGILPDVFLSNLHYVIAIIGIPLELIFSTDAYYFALFPVVEQITSQYGVNPLAAGHAMILGSIVGTFVTPFSPALWMGLGLANLSMGKHIRYSFFWVWGVALSMLAVAYVMGII